MVLSTDIQIKVLRRAIPHSNKEASNRVDINSNTPLRFVLRSISLCAAASNGRTGIPTAGAIPATSTCMYRKIECEELLD